MGNYKEKTFEFQIQKREKVIDFGLGLILQQLNTSNVKDRTGILFNLTDNKLNKHCGGSLIAGLSYVILIPVRKFSFQYFFYCSLFKLGMI